MPDLRVGVMVPAVGGSFAGAATFAARAEALGFDGAFLIDHLWPIGAPQRPLLECWTTLAALTARTQRIRLGTLVTRVTLRPPALLAKMAAAVDEIGAGRLILGLGSGDDLNLGQDEAYGLPFLEGRDRETGLREAITVIDLLWREEAPSFAGERYRINTASLLPKPVQRPRPPIWVGGGRPAARRLAAQLADGWNVWGGTATAFAAGVRALATETLAAGREPPVVVPTWAGSVIVAPSPGAAAARSRRYGPSGDVVAGTPEECAGRLADYRQAGAGWVICDFGDEDSDDALELFGERGLPVLRELAG